MKSMVTLITILVFLLIVPVQSVSIEISGSSSGTGYSQHSVEAASQSIENSSWNLSWLDVIYILTYNGFDPENTTYNQNGTLTINNSSWIITKDGVIIRN